MNISEHLTMRLDQQQAQINKLKQALTACIDVCASQNKQLGIIETHTSINRLDWNIWSDKTKENGILADDLLSKV